MKSKQQKVTRAKVPYVLGVTIAGRTVYAVLLKREAEGLEVVRRFTRQRVTRFASVQQGVPEVKGQETGGDFSIQFGGSGTATPFLKSEFDLSGDGAGSEQGPPAAIFVMELSDILAECREAGYGDPEVAFCLPSVDLSYVELRLPRRLATKDQETGPVDRKALLELLEQQVGTPLEEEQVAFLAMTPSDEETHRFLAIYPRPSEPVTATLQALKAESNRRLPRTRLFETEVSLYLGLVRTALRQIAPESPETRSLVLRVGADDTLVLFIQGETLQHAESLRSLTMHDTPETICSRILLLQDEYGIGEVSHVFLVGEHGETEIQRSLEVFFPNARIENLRRYLPLDDQEVGPGSLAAQLAALRLVGDPEFLKAFEPVNLFPSSLRRRWELPFGWQVWALYALLFVTTLFFVWRYLTLEAELNERQERLRRLPPAIAETDARALQARIDSLNARTQQALRALDVLDSLLVGSDRWSRALAQLSREVAMVRGIWVDSWRPRTDGVELKGSAIARDRVVELAQRMNGIIRALTFSEIRGWPVYAFVIEIPLPNDLPEPARYLREQFAVNAQPVQSKPSNP
ncbi:PilN domain-containing protein [Rhodothermus profundi]|uniref:Fimbrial assembly protein (PilN) n=1 Tax=Rhodothermus profundi TaxID=633813 RepID=A0A1M6Q905_9BACT|nr:hypothetical protein [Rhodothermus profundi]SHK16615.1 hypothetical protein SAMN04488087_0511 [Rhodothermus profundi]